jgi:hypothetical protein
MMTDRELLELVVDQVGKITIGLEDVKTDVNGLKDDVNGLKDEMQEVKNVQKRMEVCIEHDIVPKIQALFDGWQQNTEQLNRIEQKVTRHDELILRKIK